MKLADYLHKEDILPDLAATVRDEALDEFAASLASRYPALTRAEILQVLTERELLGSTGIGDGVAIPHGKLSTSEACILLFARSRAGVSFGALDGRPVQLFFVLLAPQSAAGMHLKVLARISRILKDPVVRHELLVAPDAASLYTTIMKQDIRY